MRYEIDIDNERRVMVAVEKATLNHIMRVAKMFDDNSDWPNGKSDVGIGIRYALNALGLLDDDNEPLWR